MKVYGTDFEGKEPWRLLPATFTGSYDSDLKANLAAIRKHLDTGGKIFVEITSGARKGTIGELVIPTTELDELYGPRYKSGLGGERRNGLTEEWQLKFDDRKTVIKITKGRYEFKWNGVLRFNCAGTVWAYESKEQPKVDPVQIFDHFGVELKVGQTVLFLHGKANAYENRFGNIKRISDKGTIWIEAFKTRSEHKTEELVHGISAKNVFVLDGNLVDKAVMAKLSL